MSFKKGFSLIELMIVVTIMAILAGAAIPYVQDYIEDARRGRCKNDLEEIRNALALFELTRRENYTQTNISKLVGPFLSKALTDPWGSSYVINSASSTCYSYGPDQTNNTGDEILVFYRPRFAVSRCNWNDLNLDGLVQVTDNLQMYLTRPGCHNTAVAYTGEVIATMGLALTMTPGPVALSPTGTYTTADKRVASFPVAAVFVPGKDTLTVGAGTVKSCLEDESITPAAPALDCSMKIFAP